MTLTIDGTSILTEDTFYRISFHFPVIEYENALIEFNGDIDEAILQRLIANPIHVYKLVREMEIFYSGAVSKLMEDLNLDGR